MRAWGITPFAFPFAFPFAALLACFAGFTSVVRANL
tara:strand:+ start:4447 stop:4554 length:108 start_codon:yes stop_codon:yes gene_type:complete